MIGGGRETARSSDLRVKGGVRGGRRQDVSARETRRDEGPLSSLGAPQAAARPSQNIVARASPPSPPARSSRRTRSHAHSNSVRCEKAVPARRHYDQVFLAEELKSRTKTMKIAAQNAPGRAGAAQPAGASPRDPRATAHGPCLCAWGKKGGRVRAPLGGGAGGGAAASSGRSRFYAYVRRMQATRPGHVRIPGPARSPLPRAVAPAWVCGYAATETQPADLGPLLPDAARRASAPPGCSAGLLCFEATPAACSRPRDATVEVLDRNCGARSRPSSRGTATAEQIRKNVPPASETQLRAGGSTG